MDAAPAQTKPRPPDPAVDRYISEFRRRHREFVRNQKQELRQIGLDVFTRVYHEYFAIPSRPTYEVLLQVILEPDERDRLNMDPQFTQAWQIFIDLCWVRARAVRTGIVMTAVIFILGTAGGILFASPQIGGMAALVFLGAILGIWILASMAGGSGS